MMEEGQIYAMDRRVRVQRVVEPALQLETAPFARGECCGHIVVRIGVKHEPLLHHST